MPDFHYQSLFERGPDETPYRKLTSDGVSTVSVEGRELLKVDAEVLRLVARTAFDDISHLLRPAHLAQLRSIFDDPESSANDRFVALELLRNANIASGRVLPGCQDTGTAIVLGHKGETVKSVGKAAREELEEFLGRKVHLFLQVKVRPNWLEESERYSEMGLDFKDGA